MNQPEFGYFLRGLCATQMTTADIAKLALDAARGILKVEPPAAARPAALIPLAVPAFCIHNVNVAEHCPSCGVDRTFGFPLPREVRHVYIGKP